MIVGCTDSFGEECFRDRLTELLIAAVDDGSSFYSGEYEGAAIIYCRNRQLCQTVSEALLAEGISATYYHAGLTYTEREMRQGRWMRGEVRVMVATNAFGMGIDKPDVRLVIHLTMPSSLEEFYQEAGRAGADVASWCPGYRR